MVVSHLAIGHKDMAKRKRKKRTLPPPPTQEEMALPRAGQGWWRPIAILVTGVPIIAVWACYLIPIRFPRAGVATHTSESSLSEKDRQAQSAIQRQIDAIEERLRMSEPPSDNPAATQIQAMLEGPEEEVSLNRAEFLIASGVPEFKGLTVVREIARMEWLAGYVRYLVEQYQEQFSADPRKFGGNEQEFRLRMLVMALNSRDLLQIAYVAGRPNPADPRQFFVNGLMDTRRGTCISMHVVYLLIAERLGWPIHGVTVKDHLFCRWDDGRYRANLEGTARGAAPQDSDYIRDFKLSADEMATTVFMKNLTKKQMVGQFLFHRSMYWVAKGRSQEAIADLTLAASVSGNDPYIHANLARLQSGELERMLSEYARPNNMARVMDVAGATCGAPDPIAESRGRHEQMPSEVSHLRESQDRAVRPAMPVPTQHGAPSAAPVPGSDPFRHPAQDDPLYYARQRQQTGQ